MKLHTRLQTESSLAKITPVLLIHGMFGSLDNLAALARGLKPDYPVIQVDVRNHGHSPHCNEISYPLMAQDMLDTLDHHGIEKVSVAGHSMGGKIAMALCALAPERIERLVVIDIAPVDYRTRHHDTIFSAIQAVSASGVRVRSQAARIMRQHTDEESVIAFLLKSFHEGEWLFNVDALWDHYATLSGWPTIAAQPHPTLFIRGECSSYLDIIYRRAVIEQFPQAKACVISGAGHWVHAEKPATVLRTLRRFLPNLP